LYILLINDDLIFKFLIDFVLLHWWLAIIMPKAKSFHLTRKNDDNIASIIYAKTCKLEE